MYRHSATWQYLCGIYGQHDIARDVQVCMGSGTLSPSVYQLIIKILWIYFSSNFDSNGPIRSQFCTWHDSLTVMTCAKLWPDLIIICHVRATWIFTRFGSWAHKPFVEWVWALPKWDLAIICCHIHSANGRHTRRIDVRRNIMCIYG